MRRIGTGKARGAQPNGVAPAVGDDRAFWSDAYELEMTEEDARQASANLLGLFEALAALAPPPEVHAEVEKQP